MSEAGFVLNMLSDEQPVELRHSSRDVLTLLRHCHQLSDQFLHIPQLVE